MIDTVWNLAELENYTRTHADNDSMVSELISSLSRSDTIFRYHVATARDAMKGIINFEEPQDQENWMLVLGGSERQKDFYYAKIVSEANLVGCVYAARSLLEVFAQLLNCIVLRSRIPIPQCTLKKVVGHLPDGELKVKLQELVTSNWFTYLSAFTNTVKHRQLVQHQISISFVENVIGIKVGSFEYEGVTYQAYWANDFLQGVIEVKNAVIESGRLLNRTLRPGTV